MATTNDDNRSDALPLDLAYAAVGIANDTQAHRRGGPSCKALKRLRSGCEIRSDATLKLAKVLGVSEAEALAVMRATAMAARARRSAS